MNNKQRDEIRRRLDELRGERDALLVRVQGLSTRAEAAERERDFQHGHWRDTDADRRRYREALNKIRRADSLTEARELAREARFPDLLAMEVEGHETCENCKALVCTGCEDACPIPRARVSEDEVTLCPKCFASLALEGRLATAEAEVKRLTEALAAAHRAQPTALTGGDACAVCGHARASHREQAAVRAALGCTAVKDGSVCACSGFVAAQPPALTGGDSGTLPSHQPDRSGGDARLVGHNDANGQAWHALALVYGYNELVKTATTLGEKVYARIARDHLEEEAAKAGVKINRGDQGAVVLEMTSAPPFIVFHERDIEAMRAAVAKFDAHRASPVGKPPRDDGQVCGHGLTGGAYCALPKWHHEPEVTGGEPSGGGPTLCDGSGLLLVRSTLESLYGCDGCKNCKAAR